MKNKNNSFKKGVNKTNNPRLPGRVNPKVNLNFRRYKK
jgi:hypothetical protein